MFLAGLRSHAVLQIKAPLLPNGGRYLEGLNDTGELGNLPFISLNLRLLDSPKPGGMLLTNLLGQPVVFRLVFVSRLSERRLLGRGRQASVHCV